MTFLDNWPDCVTQQWIRDHDETSSFWHLSGSVRELITFERRTMLLEELPDIGCIRDRGRPRDPVSRNYTPSEAQEAKQASETWSSEDDSHEYTANDVSDYMFLHGTWPRPIILTENAEGTKVFADHEPLKTPWHLLEGHTRLLSLLYLNRDRLLPQHDVWIASW